MLGRMLTKSIKADEDDTGEDIDQSSVDYYASGLQAALDWVSALSDTDVNRDNLDEMTQERLARSDLAKQWMEAIVAANLSVADLREIADRVGAFSSGRSRSALHDNIRTRVTEVSRSVGQVWQARIARPW